MRTLNLSPSPSMTMGGMQLHDDTQDDMQLQGDMQLHDDRQLHDDMQLQKHGLSDGLVREAPTNLLDPQVFKSFRGGLWSIMV